MSWWRFAGGFLALWLVWNDAAAAPPPPPAPPESAPAPPESAPALPERAPASVPPPESAPVPDDLEDLLFGDTSAAPASATRFPAPRADAPSTITVITREEIELHGFHTLGEALHFLPGLFVEADERRLHLVSRGLPDSMLLVFDAVPLISDAARLDLPLEDEFDLRKLARIEIVRGPGSAAWGRNAFGGVVSLVPITGADLGGVRADLSIGSAATRHLSVVGGDRFGDFDIAGAVSYRTTFEPAVTYRGTPTFFVFPLGPDQPFRIPAGLADRTGANAPDAALEAWARASFRGLSLSARFADYADFGPLASFSHAVLPREANELRAGRSLLVKAALEQPLGRRADLTAIAFVNLRDVAETERLYPFADPFTSFGGAVHTTGSTWTAGAHLVLDWRLLDFLAATAGVQVDTSRSALEASFTDPATGVVTLSGVARRAESTAGSAWLLARFTPPRLDALTLWAGVGLDLHSDFAPALNPRAALVLRPGGGFTVRALYGEADRTPDQFDLIALAASAFEDGGVGGVAPNPNLSPERLRSGELTAEWSLPGRFRIEAAGFITHARGLVVREVLMAEEAVQARNGGARLLYGGELTARAELLDGALLLGAAYGLVLGEDRGRDPLVPDAVAPARDAPVHEGTATIAVRPHAALTLTLDALLIGPRPLRDGSGSSLPAELTFDAHVALRVPVPGARLRFELRARNLTGAETFSRNEGVPNRSPTVHIPGGPTTVLFTVGGDL